MPFNLLKTIQETLGYPELKKVDPNTQETPLDMEISDKEKFSQAAIPTVLVGLHKYVETEEGLKTIVSGYESDNWFEKIFGNVSPAIIDKITDYSNFSSDIVTAKMYDIANETVRVTREHINAPGNVLNLRDFMLAQLTNILPYLPAALQIGKLLNDSTLDDRTNKMRGPVSSFMRSMEGVFSPGDSNTKEDHF